ncbi:hypothetical protein BC936DRAFT_138013 [Jimgerdemannia flammicorona]|uniref:Uncharacterized protein n=1 Tax=Jimgerdemannia flammicorona TaxID=994334 RepID=A0A433DIU7_9FUNG|nr:hypothetical protein BC936DRAFT_138013 [Jimgerdemannia flammicorona]
MLNRVSRETTPSPTPGYAISPSKRSRGAEASVHLAIGIYVNFLSTSEIPDIHLQQDDAPEQDEEFSSSVMVLRNNPPRINYTIPNSSPDAAQATDSSYIPSSPLSDTPVSKPNEDSCMNYFVGPGIIEWNMEDCLSRWIIGEIDISGKCYEYRMAIIKKCRALSHVFVFQEENPFDLDGYFDDELWGTLFIEFRKLYPYTSISDNIIQMFANTVKVEFLDYM